ncbi:MAG: DNA-binding response regulator [Citrobacter freundii]|nr:MAG: DNA-binding response regulator [Citrobacter freundii]
MNILIVEDETQTAEYLREVIEQQGDFIVVKTLDSIVSAVDYLSSHQQHLDLLFLDIQLADGAGFEIFKHIDVTVPVIFCTAYDNYAMQAIKSNGIDYILKPFEEKAVHNALEKYKRMIDTIGKKARNAMAFPTHPKVYQESFLGQLREKLIVTDTTDIAVFSIEHDLVYLYTYKGEKLPLFKNMDYVESVVNPFKFFRISRQMLVSRDAIRSIQPYFNRKVILELKVDTSEKPIVSRLKVAPLKEWLESGVKG